MALSRIFTCLIKSTLVIAAFNHRKKAGETITVSINDETPIVPKLDEAITDTATLESKLPYMRGTISAYLQGKGWFTLSLPKQQQELNTLWEYLLNPAYFIKESTAGPELALFGDDTAEKFSDILSASDAFVARWLRDFYFVNQRQQLLQHYEGLLRKYRKTITLTNERLRELEVEVPLEEIGHILMANLHQVEQGIELVVLEDFYRGGTIRIKLNKKLSPQQNAEGYYRKAKNRHIEKETLIKRLEEAQKREQEIQQTLQSIQQATQPGELRSYKTAVKNKEQDDAPLPYRELEYQGWTIRVGKSAGNNDELITRYAHKDDIWLHARSVAGSHVLIKNKAGQPVPAPVLEKAASLAAWYSKGKSESLCAVIYTQRKYVRKPKGAAPGKVLVEKEQVLMVAPKSYEG